LWANSGDSHIIEPMNLFDRLPDHIRDRMPRSVKDPSGEFETIYVDGQEFRRDMPKPDPAKPKKGFGGINARPIGTTDNDFIERVINGNDAEHRIKDLDNEGVWGEVIYPGLGIWQFNIRTPEVARAGARVLNEFVGHFQSKSERFVCCATLPLADVDDAIAELRRCRDEGFLIAFLPVRPPNGRPEWHDDEWAPLWAAFEESGMRIGFHNGTEPMLPNQRQGL
jgi:predicted TIM-barrel fold metal-dependent hydrolase